MIHENFKASEPLISDFLPGLKYIKTETPDPLIFCAPERSGGFVISDEDERKLNPKRRFVFVIRHGETDWNKEGRFQGRQDNPVNETGENQARRCGEMIQKALERNGLTAGKIFSSPLSRAKKTASIIADRLEIPLQETVPDLTERDYGKLSGLTPSERKEKFGDVKTDDVDGTESLEASGMRLFGALKILCRENPRSNLLAVSHGGILNSLVSMCTGGKIGAGVTLTVNCCVNVFSEDKGVFTLEAYNLTPAGFGEYKIFRI